ncbi:hypothetical protein [Dolichospermum sp. LEGE 00246]|uniref:hypothetical protein n=1 Tax=Dolichospermum sp. LEGE 00246 TaxID=1828605 RepID=UPI00187E7DD3|nr:hypothetical protein [Dolichospermum sp. LEGE 00246]MBE9256374.1 hypothetical protein [Dolichospermum sp. LEGE 00246]
MLNNWLSNSTREPCPYKFGVRDITECSSPNLSDPEDTILNHLSYHLLMAHGDPEKIKGDCKILLEDLEELKFDKLKSYVEDIIKNYVNNEILPSNKPGFQLSTWIGNFGEVLASQILIDSEEFWFPIYKLRFREKRSWAMKLTDLCLIKTNGLSKPLICYGEVKTKSSACDPKLGIKGHDSLVKDDALEKPEILNFFCNMLYVTKRIDEADFLTRIRLGKIDYDKQHYLFLIHDKSTWKEEVLSNLNSYQLNSDLINFSITVVLVEQLRQVIDESYSRAWKSVEGWING